MVAPIGNSMFLALSPLHVSCLCSSNFGLRITIVILTDKQQADEMVEEGNFC